MFQKLIMIWQAHLKEPIWPFNYYWKPRHQLFQKPPSEKCKCNYDMMYYLQPNLQLPLMICAGRSLVLKVYTKFHVGLSDFLPIIIKSYILTLFPTHNRMKLPLRECSIIATWLKWLQNKRDRGEMANKTQFSIFLEKLFSL